MAVFADQDIDQGQPDIEQPGRIRKKPIIVAQPPALDTGGPESPMIAAAEVSHPAPVVASLPKSSETKPLIASGVASDDSAVPGLPKVNLTPSSGVGSGAAPASAQPALSTAPAGLPRDIAEWNRLKNSPTGIEKLHASAKNPFLHTLENVGIGGLKALDIAGSVFTPGLAAAIPGTRMHHIELENRAAGNVARDVGQEQVQAETQKALADAHKAQSEANATPVDSKIDGYTNKDGQRVEVMQRPDNSTYERVGGKVQDKTGTSAPDLVLHDLMTGNKGGPRVNPQTGQPYTYLEAYQATQKQSGPNQEQNKLAFQTIIGKLDSAHLPTDPKRLDASLDAALARGIISQQEHSQARGYEGANPTPGSNLTVRIAGQEAAQAMKDKHSYYLYDGKMVTGDNVPANADAIPIKDPQQFKAGATVANTVAKSFNHLADDEVKIFDDPKARAVLATALSDEQARNMGLLVAGTGGSISLPGGAGKIIDQLLENHAVPENIRREVKNYIVDYWGMRDKLLAMQMEMQGGKIGRGNAVFFNAMLAQLPGPGTSDSVMARRQLNLLSETMRSLKEQYGDLADVEPRTVKGDTGEPRSSGGAQLSPAGQQYLNSILGH